VNARECHGQKCEILVLYVCIYLFIYFD
jgi:hypothetical protein